MMKQMNNGQTAILWKWNFLTKLNIAIFYFFGNFFLNLNVLGYSKHVNLAAIFQNYFFFFRECCYGYI